MQGSCLLSTTNFCASKTKLPYPCKVEVLSQRALSFDLYLCVERDCTELSQMHDSARQTGSKLKRPGLCE